MISYIEMQSLMADPNNALLQNSVTDDEYALIVAITYNNTKSIIELLKREPSLHNINFLWLAVTNNNIEPVNIFLNEFSVAEMIEGNSDTEDVLMSAIDKKHYGVIHELIKNPILKERLTRSDRIRKYLLDIMSPNEEVGDNNFLDKFVVLLRYWWDFGPLFVVERWIAFVVKPEAEKSREPTQEQQQQPKDQQPYFMQYSGNRSDFLLDYNKRTYKFESFKTCLLSLVLIELLCNENGFVKMNSLGVIDNLNIALSPSSTPKLVETAVKKLGLNFHPDKIDQHQYNKDVYKKIIDSVDKAVREKIDKENAANQIQKLGRLIFGVIGSIRNNVDKQEFVKFFTSLQNDFKMAGNAKDYRKNIGVKEVVVERNVKANNAFSIRNTIQKNRKAAEEQSRKAAAERMAAEEQDRKATAERMAAEEQDRKAAAERMAAEEQDRKATAERMAAEEQDRKATAERMAAEEQSRKAAELMAAEEQSRKAAAERMAADEQDRKAAAERIAAEEQSRKAAAERMAAEEQDRKAAAERMAAEEQDRKAAAERMAAEEQDRKAAAERMAAEEQDRKAAAERMAAEEQDRNSTDERKTTPTTSQQDDTSTSNVASSPVVNESLWQKIKNFFKYIFNSFVSVFFGEQPEVKVVVDPEAIEHLKNYIKERLRGDTSKDDELENILKEKDEYEVLLKVKSYVDGHTPPLKFSQEKSPNMDDLDKELKKCLKKNNII